MLMMMMCVNRNSSAVDSMSDYGDQGSSETKSESASPLTAELSNGAAAGLHPTSVAAVWHRPSSVTTPGSGVDRGQTSPLAGSGASYGGVHHQLQGIGSLVDRGGLGCSSLDDDGSFLAMNMAAAAAAAAAAAGTFNIGSYNRLQ